MSFRTSPVAAAHPSAIATRADLVRAFECAAPIVERSVSYPILQNALMQGDGQTLFVITTDLDMEICVAVPAAADSRFAVTLPAKLMLSTLKNAKTTDYVAITAPEVEARDLVASLDLEALKVDMAGFAADAFPMPKRDFANAARFSLPGAVLHDVLGAVMGAVSTEETRYYLNGVYMHPVAGKLVLVATDGHRLYKQVMALPKGAEAMPGVILPRKTVSALHRLTKGKHCPDTVAIEINERLGRFAFGNVTLTTKMIEGTFPDYERVTPKSNDKRAVFDGPQFNAALAQLLPVTKTGGKAVKLTLSEGRCSMECRNSDGGAAAASAPADFENDQFEIGFNATYLRDLLGVAGASVTADFRDSNGPALFQGSREGWLAVLMPMRV